MPLIVNGVTIPSTKGSLTFDGVILDKVDVVKDGVTTTVWTSTEPKSWTLEITEGVFGHEEFVDIYVDTSLYSTATLVVSGGAFGYGTNGSYVDLSWYGVISEVGTHVVPVGNGRMKLHCGGPTQLACTLTFS